MQLRLKKKSIQEKIVVFSFLSLSFVFFHAHPAFSSNSCKDFLWDAYSETQELFTMGTDFKREGLTPTGLEVLKEMRDRYRARLILFNSQIRSLDTIHHAATLARLTQEHMMFNGPPSGGKSMVANWMLKGEREKPFKLQMHQMLTEMPIVGGQNFEAAKEGRFEVNTEGALIEHAIGLIDELDKGSPQIYAPLLSLLEENQALLGNRVVRGRLETLFTTSNSNLAELRQYFRENGMQNTADALFSRFGFKAFTYNWLSPEDQAFIDKRNERKRQLMIHARLHPEVLKDEIFLNPEPLNWQLMRELGNAMFTISPGLFIRAREFATQMRSTVIGAMKESAATQKKDRLDPSQIYYPAGDPTERLRQKILKVIIMSAFLDYLKSPLADKDSDLEAVYKNPIELDEVSLWRAYLLMTTIGPGDVKLVYHPEEERSLEIDFDWSINPREARDDREEGLILDVLSEQDRFKELYVNTIDKMQGVLEDRAVGTAPITSKRKKVKQAQESVSFELRLLQAREN